MKKEPCCVIFNHYDKKLNIIEIKMTDSHKYYLIDQIQKLRVKYNKLTGHSYNVLEYYRQLAIEYYLFANFRQKRSNKYMMNDYTRILEILSAFYKSNTKYSEEIIHSILDDKLTNPLIMFDLDNPIINDACLPESMENQVLYFIPYFGGSDQNIIGHTIRHICAENLAPENMEIKAFTPKKRSIKKVINEEKKSTKTK